MRLERYDPFATHLSTLWRMQDVIHRFFEDSLLQGRLDPSRGARWAPPCDVYEDDEHLVFKFDLPEVRRSDVNVRVENGVLTVEGSRTLESEERKDNYERIERFYGKFCRSFSLPSTLDADKIAADLKDGVLRVSIPKRPEAQPRTIEIKG